MRLFQVFVSLLILSAYAKATETNLQGQIARPPDAGISDQYLVALGTAAVPALIERLEDPKNEPFFPGLVDRLSKQGKEHPDPRILRAFQEFLQVQSARDVVSRETVTAMRRSLEVSGYVAGHLGTPYLMKWFDEEGPLRTVRCRMKDVDYTKVLLLEAAALGLGYTGDPDALRLLRRLDQYPPKIQYVGSFRGVVHMAIEINEEINKLGIKGYFWKYDRSNPDSPLNHPKPGDPMP